MNPDLEVTREISGTRRILSLLFRDSGFITGAMPGNDAGVSRCAKRQLFLPLSFWGVGLNSFLIPLIPSESRGQSQEKVPFGQPP